MTDSTLDPFSDQSGRGRYSCLIMDKQSWSCLSCMGRHLYIAAMAVGEVDKEQRGQMAFKSTYPSIKKKGNLVRRRDRLSRQVRNSEEKRAVDAKEKIRWAWFWLLELLFNGSIACWSRHIRRTITDAYATVSWAEFFLSIKRMGAWPWLQQQQGVCLAAIPGTYSLQLTNYLVLQFIFLQL